MTDEMRTQSNTNGNEVFKFSWDKHFSYLTLNQVETQVSLSSQELSIDTRNNYLGIIKGKVKNRQLPLINISRIDIKKKINLSDMIFGAIFTVLGFANPLFFLFALLIIWTGIGTKLILTTNLSNKIVIPTDLKSDAEKFVSAINAISIRK